MSGDIGKEAEEIVRKYNAKSYQQKWYEERKEKAKEDIQTRVNVYGLSLDTETVLRGWAKDGLTIEEQGVFLSLLRLAASSDRPGQILLTKQNQPVAYNEGLVTFSNEFSQEKWEPAFKRFIELDMIKVENSILTINHWERYSTSG